MGPVVPIVQAVKGQLMRVMPDVSYELGTISETLNNMVMEVGEATGTSYDMVASGEEAQKILKEAGAIAEQHMSERFPELPTPSSSTEGEISTSKGL
jgi:division protein CdvB (Snf7/Vps24/ESCRT-III family)